MNKRELKELVKTQLDGFLEENGYELWNVESVKEGRDQILRVFVDLKDDGYIGTDDCEKVSRFLSEKLDANDPFEDNYYLEVSSPGLDRELSEEWHFDRCLGELVEVKLYSPMNGEKLILCRLEGLVKNGDKLEGLKLSKIEDDDTEIELELSRKAIAKINLAVVF